MTNSQECPVGTYKDTEGSGENLCTPCSFDSIPTRAEFIYVRGNFYECCLTFI